MSAAMPAQNPAGGDPSMEDILSSIRRILNEEDTAPSPPTAKPAPAPLPPTPAAGSPPQPAPEDDVLLLDAAMLVRDQPAAAAPSQPAEPVAATVRIRPGGPTIEEILREELRLMLRTSFGESLPTLLQQRVREELRGPVKAALDERLHAMVEPLVAEELRGQLKAWLDEHLQPLLERLVRAEIERVLGRRG